MGSTGKPHLPGKHHRSPIRWKILYPRCSGCPFATSCCFLSSRIRRFLFGGPQYQGKNYQRRYFPGTIGENPRRFLPEMPPQLLPPVNIDLDRPMIYILAELSKYPIKTRLKLNGTLIVARDMAHVRIKEMLDNGEPMPEYFKNHPVYYAGPAKTPEGMPSGSFGPTTAGRMDSYVDQFQAAGGSMIMLAKGNRSHEV